MVALLEPSTRTLSPQQQAVVDFVGRDRRSAFVEAVAGAGKTTKLIEALSATRGSVAFMAYNKKIADEIKTRTSEMRFGNRVKIGTFHSFGLGAWRYVHKNVKCGPDAALKKAELTVAHLAIPKTIESFTARLVSLAKQRALGLFGSIDDDSQWYEIVEHFDLAFDLEDPELVAVGVEKAIESLKFHREVADRIIDFDDMIYMPVTTGIRMWQNDVIFVDEAQDTNPARRALVRRMLNPRGGRAVFVGDRRQAIYGFTGADNDSVDQIVKDFGCVQLPMTTTYRCPKAVVRKAQEVVAHIEAHHTAPEGSVARMDFNDFVSQHLKGEFPLSPTDAILCRKTRPLVALAFQLIRAGTPCHVEGRDIGAGLVALVDRFKNARSVDALIRRLCAHTERACNKLEAKGKNVQAESLKDRAATVECIAAGCASVADIVPKINSLFNDSDNEPRPTTTLSTVHKSKGREWPRVFILGENQWMPGPWAKQQWEIDQEYNLMYVAYTRSQQDLVLLDVEK